MKELLASYVEGLSLRAVGRLAAFTLGSAAVFTVTLTFAAGAPWYLGAALGALAGLAAGIDDQTPRI